MLTKQRLLLGQGQISMELGGTRPLDRDQRGKMERQGTNAPSGSTTGKQHPTLFLSEAKPTPAIQSSSYIFVLCTSSTLQ